MKMCVLFVVIAAFAGCKEEAPTNAGSSPTSASAQPGSAGQAAQPAATPKPAEPAAPKADSAKTVVDVAVGSPDHTTLVAALKAADLVGPLASPGGVYTIFAPTNAAFAKLPKGTVETLLQPEKKGDLKTILQHHAAVPILQVKDLRDGQTLAMADGTSVTFHVKNGKVMVNDANVVASVPAMNGIVHVIDGVLLPTPK